MSIRCGNRAAHATRTYHATVDAVRACHRDNTAPCHWLVERVSYTEDGPMTTIVDCGALSWPLPGGRGWACEAGHEHVTAEVRAAEGWEYAEDQREARRLEKAGVRPVMA